MKVKICGIVCLEDALMAASLGADALGFLVGVRHRAEDAIPASEARRIVHSLPPFVASVLVTHLTEAEPIIKLWQEIGTTAIQLHDDTPLFELRTLRQRLPGVSLTKAVHVTGPEAVDKALRYRGLVNAIVADTVMSTEDRIGGTGRTHDWEISRRIRETCSLPLILAGGLTPDNVALAVRSVKPYAVDVNSGVEDPQGCPKGRKDPERLKAFIETAREAARLLGL